MKNKNILEIMLSIIKNEQNIINNLTEKHIQFLENLPLFLKYGNITIVHGGIQNHMNLDDLSKKDKQKILRLRFLDENYEYLTFGKEDEKEIADTTIKRKTRIASKATGSRNSFYL